MGCNIRFAAKRENDNSIFLYACEKFSSPKSFHESKFTVFLNGIQVTEIKYIRFDVFTFLIQYIIFHFDFRLKFLLQISFFFINSCFVSSYEQNNVRCL